MKLTEFIKAIQKHFAEMAKDAKRLFEVEVDYEEMLNLYFASYPEGTNEIYHKRREFDCSCCKRFIRDIGNVVAIKDGKIHTIWELDIDDGVFSVVAKALDQYIRGKEVKGVYLRTEKRIGTPESREMLPTGEVHKYYHFYINLPKICIYKEDSENSLEGEKGLRVYERNQFQRSLEKLDPEAVDTVLELISQNSLYRGAEWKAVVMKFRDYQKEYRRLPDEEKELWVWEKSVEAGAAGRIRNSAMGTLMERLSDGTELNEAVSEYDRFVAPANYKRPRPIYTKKMLEDARNTITELGYLDALQRRFATLDDITVNNILFSNKDAARRISGADALFGELEKEVTINPRKFSRVEEISVRDFVDNVLPTAKELEAFLENRHMQNMVSLIAPENKEAKSMFKWKNAFSWAYTGNITDSDIKENVKKAGGSVTGVLRFSIQWNYKDRKDNSDLDAHCEEPEGGNHIYYRNQRSAATGGKLDVDVTHPIEELENHNREAVENIIYKSKENMLPGVYKFYVNQYCFRHSQGFKAEIEADGEIHSYEYDKPVYGNIQVAEVVMDENGNFKVIDKLDANRAPTSREVWGVRTNQFLPVSVVCYSPNYWDEQKGRGHQHLFFMLKGCVNPEEPNGFYNEFLKRELEKHRKVFEALGVKAHVKDMDDQLSGVGFSLTKRNELVVRVKGASERTLRIKF